MLSQYQQQQQLHHQQFNQQPLHQQQLHQQWLPQQQLHQQQFHQQHLHQQQLYQQQLYQKQLVHYPGKWRGVIVVFDSEKSPKGYMPPPTNDGHCPSLVFESRFESGNLRQARRTWVEQLINTQHCLKVRVIHSAESNGTSSGKYFYQHRHNFVIFLWWYLVATAFNIGEDSHYQCHALALCWNSSCDMTDWQHCVGLKQLQATTINDSAFLHTKLLQCWKMCWH